MTTNYNRTKLYSFSELSKEQQEYILENYKEAQETKYVVCQYKGNETALPVDMFSQTPFSNKFTHGVYANTTFSGYYLTFANNGKEAVVAYKIF